MAWRAFDRRRQRGQISADGYAGKTGTRLRTRAARTGINDQEDELVRSLRLPTLASRLTMALAVIALPALGEGMAAVRLAPDEICLTADASRPGGMEMATLAGDMARTGLYAARIRIPGQLRIQPHTHPEDRVVVVLSGTLHFGFGDRFEPALLKALPSGSFFVEPAGQPHFAWAQTSDVILQVSGIGPSGTVYVGAGDAGH
jgi:uncharacterized RmlC-like cupin family protein